MATKEVIIADSSPLIGLARIGRLELLVANHIFIRRELIDAALQDAGE